MTTTTSIRLAAAFFSVAAVVAPANAQTAPSTIPTGIDTGRICPSGDQSLHEAAWALSVTASAEARSEGLLGMALTIEVMANRICAARKSYGGASARGVVLHPWAFSVYNMDSSVRDQLIRLLHAQESDGSEIGQYAEEIYPIAVSILQGWRTGLLPHEESLCRHYKTREATASWASSAPDLRFGDHEFFCGVDGPV